MILVDTSIWVEYLRRGSELLSDMLESGRILSHPFVVGELALGGMKRTIVDDLLELPPAAVATDDEVLEFIDRHRLVDRGIGYVDAHLLASTRLMGDAQIWTSDRSLRSIAEAMKLYVTFSH